MDKVVTRTCEIHLDELNILHVRMLDGVTIDKEDAMDNFLVEKNLAQGKAVLKLIDARNKFTILKEAQGIIDSENNPQNHIAKAIIVSLSIEKYLRNFYISLAYSRFPVKLFISEEKAMDWLKERTKNTNLSFA